MEGTSSLRRGGAFGASLLLMAAGSLSWSFAGCQSPSPDATGDAAGELIKDANHNMGVKGFAFLQPIATAPVKSTGKFEPRLAPEEQLGAVDGDGKVTNTIATFDATHKVDGEKVRRNRNK